MPSLDNVTTFVTVVLSIDMVCGVLSDGQDEICQRRTYGI